MRAYNMLCILGFGVSLIGVCVHLGAVLFADFDGGNAPTPESNRLYAVALISFFTACLGGLTALSGLIRLGVAGRIRQEMRSFWLGCAALAGPAYLATVYGVMFVSEL